MPVSEKVLAILSAFEISVRTRDASAVKSYTVEELKDVLIQALADRHTPAYKAIEHRIFEIEKNESLKKETEEIEPSWLKYSKIWVPIFCTLLGSSITWYLSNSKYRSGIGELKREIERLQIENVTLKHNFKSEAQILLEIKNVREDLSVQKNAIKDKYNEKRARWPEQLNARGLLHSGDLKSGIEDFNRQEAKEIAEVERVSSQKIGLLKEELKNRQHLNSQMDY